MHILLAGASGLIGSALQSRLRAAGHELRVLVRREPTAEHEVRWDPDAHFVPGDALNGIEAVINLGGASIGKLPWTARYREQLLTSRLSGTQTLVRAIRTSAAPPRILINASASGFYGSRPGETLDESSPTGAGFLAGLTVRWEAAALEAADRCTVVLARTGIVLDPAGAIGPMLTLTKLGLGGPLGSGKNVWPWVSLDDEVRALEHLLTSTLTGPVNIVGPEPATAGEVGRALAETLGRPYWLPAPAFALRLVLQDAAEDLLLVDQHIRPSVLLSEGFEFTHPTAEGALRAALEPR
ncbi:TIGR01777 family protein [Mycetocola tolaasinivorans]|uniref:TIGR01777 family protein n=1 Tax=Mycetocola tolaasinivorans TaxID=76635 RepID=A0A3L7AEF3_9MICO|nr:TIGR01777 family oxidoreductase [Mycetocola tolaasinivorans]RLP77772.1 TIGR01777 family protein [Mycetocola tolaasinivorans]